MLAALFERIPGLEEFLDWVFFIVSDPIHLILFIIFILVCLVFLLLAYSLILRMQNNRRRRYITKLENIWQPLVWKYLAGDYRTGGFINAVKKKDYHIFGEFIERYLVDLRGTDYDKLIILLQEMKFGKLKIKQLYQKSEWERAYSANFLGIIGYKASISDLEKLLEDSSPITAFFVAKSLLILGGPSQFSTIMGILNNRQDFNSEKMRGILFIYGKTDSKGLIELLESSELSSLIIIDIVHVLAQLGVFEAGDQLLHLGKHTQHEEIKIACIKALGELSILKAADFMINNLKNDNWVIRSQAAKNLGKISDEKVIKQLSSILEDHNYWVKYHSAGAIAELGESGISFLKEYCLVSDNNKSKNIINQILGEVT